MIRVPVVRDANTSNVVGATERDKDLRSWAPPAEPGPDLVMRDNLGKCPFTQHIVTRRADGFDPIAVFTQRARINPASSGQRGAQDQADQSFGCHGGVP